MINLHNHNPDHIQGYYTDNTISGQYSNDSIRNELLNIVTNQINSIANNNRLNINIFNSSLNGDNNSTTVYQS